jgi:hypothetical protein
VFTDNQSNLLPISLFSHRDSRRATLGQQAARAPVGRLLVRKAMGTRQWTGARAPNPRGLAAFYLLSQQWGCPSGLVIMVEKSMRNPRYVVVNEDAGWRIVQGGRRYPGSFSSKTLAIVTAIGFAESDGYAGHRPEVLVYGWR